MKKSVVIVGAGFGGLRTAIILAKHNQPVTLINKTDYHTYIPLLYEVAVTTNKTANHCDLKSIITLPIKELIDGLPITFIKDEVQQIDLLNNDVHYPNSHLHFDFLVLAMGTETNYSNIPGLQKNAVGFKTFLDAIKIRDLLTSLPIGSKPTVVIGGGGATGVELAGEIQHAGLANVILIQSPPEILPGFPQKVIIKAKKRLLKLGATVIFDRIIRADEKTVSLQNNGDIKFDLLIWTGGTTVNKLIHSLPLKKEERGRIEAISAMECLPQTPELNLTNKIYALGDIVCLYDKNGEPIPGLASIALDQATVVANNILGRKSQYKLKKLPYILPIGGKYAIFNYGDFVLEGFSAWLLKGLVELRYLLAIMPWYKAFQIWLKGLKIFLENDRLG